MGSDLETLRNFSELTPDTVIDLAEEALGERLASLCRPLNSYINRVYELQKEGGEGIIIKFYRPGRWSRTALEDEHQFLDELAELEVPVIAPLKPAGASSLHENRGMFYTIFPKKLGRSFDEPSDEQWEELGRLMARVHNVGAARQPQDRIIMGPRHSMTDNIRFILETGCIPRDQRKEYERAALDMVELIAPMFEGTEMIRIHGDCHAANIVHRPGESFYLIDFDDMAIGPPVQDFWMLLPDYGRKSLMEIDFFLEGYQTFRPFNRSRLKLIEPLRAMRYIHYTAWCAAQISDGGFAKVAPGWGTPGYWRQEIRDLHNQQLEIEASQNAFWGM